MAPPVNENPAQPSPNRTALLDKPQMQPLPSSKQGLAASQGIRKRIIVCCDGTWQNGVESLEWRRHSNVMKLARMINHQDDKPTPVPQIVFYQAGIGCGHNIYSEWIDGATGSSLLEKVHEAYGFIAHNYQEGDEIFLFGFSRGAYTARMTADFIGEVGVLDKHDMNYFAEIFATCQKKNKPKSGKEKENALADWEKYSPQITRSKQRAHPDGGNFSIKCLGVFDTVGLVGLPMELRLNHRSHQLLSFADRNLGEHIQYAFHAMALNENRVDFDVTHFVQTNGGRERGQTLKQVWFPGSHSDIGGGYYKHDLSDISLTWMASNIAEFISLDLDYLRRIPQPAALWGALPPHNPKRGIFKLSLSHQRQLDSGTETFLHPSVTHQTKLADNVQKLIQDRPKFFWELTALEKEMKDTWPQPSDDAKEPHTHKLERILISAKKALRNLSWPVIGRGHAEIPGDRARTGYLGCFFFRQNLHKVHSW